MKERAEQARITDASVSYDESNRITRIFVFGGKDEDDVIIVRTLWDDEEVAVDGIIRENTVNSSIITSQEDAADIADEMLNDYGQAPFEGELTIVDPRYDSYKLYNDCNGLMRVVISELGIDGWFEIDQITTSWDGGNNWVNTIRLGDTTAKYRIPDLEGWSRKIMRTGLASFDSSHGIYKVTRRTFEDYIAPGATSPPVAGFKKSHPPGTPVDEDDMETETYDKKYIVVRRLDKSSDAALYMDIGTSEANPDSEEIQTSKINGTRPLCKKLPYTYKGWNTYYAVLDKEKCRLPKSVTDDTGFNDLTIKEVALCTGDTPGDATEIARVILKNVSSATTGYARDTMTGCENYHAPVKFSSSDKIYVFFDVSVPV